MSAPLEWNKKITVSIGAIIFLAVAIFTGTTIYTEVTTLENRMEKRYARMQNEIEYLKEIVYHQRDQIIDLEKATGI